MQILLIFYINQIKNFKKKLPNMNIISTTIILNAGIKKTKVPTFVTESFN